MFNLIKLMLFYDLENFKKSLAARDSTRHYDVGKFQYVLISLLNKLKITDCNNESLIRTYAYTGEYTPNLIKKIEKDITKTPNGAWKEHKENVLEDCRRRYEGQQSFIEKAKRFNFFELRTIPLKYEEGRIFQKGVDVQIAVDLVSHGYKNNFDIVVVCSGDIDLLESIKTVKSLGKKVIITSHPDLMSKQLHAESDYFIDLSKLTDEEIESFSWIPT